MAGDWIKMTKDLADKPEVRKLARLLAVSRYDIVGRLFCVWSWADSNSLNGSMNITCDDIDDIAGLRGFADALRKVGWLEGRDESLEFPNFERHNGQTAKARAESNRRMAKSRALRNKSNTCCEDVAESPQQKPQPEKRREEKSNTSTTTPSHEVERFPRSIEEVEHFMANQVMKPLDAEVHECASKFFDEMEAIGWRNKRGIPLDKWHPLARQYAANWARNTAEANFQGVRSIAGTKNCNNNGTRRGNVRTDINDLGVKWE